LYCTIQIPSQILLKFFHFRPDFLPAGVLAEHAPQFLPTLGLISFGYPIRLGGLFE
jgi:hypothetical protein